MAVEVGLLHHYQIARLTTFLHPNATSNNPFIQSANYNLQASTRTIGSGGFFGTGIGHGTQTNLGYVPEAQTDFIFTAVAEQLGFIGAAGLLALLGIIAWRILRVAGTSRDVVRSAGGHRALHLLRLQRLSELRHDHGDHAHHRNPASIRELRRYGGTVLLHVRGPGAQYRGPEAVAMTEVEEVEEVKEVDGVAEESEASAAGARAGARSGPNHSRDLGGF